MVHFSEWSAALCSFTRKQLMSFTISEQLRLKYYSSNTHYYYYNYIDI